MGDNDQRLLRSDVGEPTVRMMAMPKDANWLGDIFGGWLMSHADIAGAVLAYRRARGKVVTVGVKEFDFSSPVYIGDVVTFFTRITRTGRTSLTVHVRVFAERPGALPGDYIEVASGSFVYVHVDDFGKSVQLPEL
ncbi:MAG: acyl-CoA thioesterase [Gammaproteobacteria bacterium]|nr:acyl-CoA thioesterase [Gammaproteobacteria bacterium]